MSQLIHQCKRLSVTGLGILLSLLLLSGCSILRPVDTSTSHTYTLTPPLKKVRVRSHRLPKTLLIASPKTNPAYRDARMAYRLKPYRVDYFAKHHWVAPPTNMLLGLLHRDLQNRHVFQSVVSEPFAGLSDYRLQVTVMVFEQEFVKAGSYARLVLSLELMDMHSHRVLATQQLKVSVPMQAATPYAGVVAINRGLAILLPRIAQFCVRYAHA